MRFYRKADRSARWQGEAAALQPAVESRTPHSLTVEFFSFGTNDLTQTALGMSRDDSGSFLPHYAELEIVKQNPFATID